MLYLCCIIGICTAQGCDHQATAPDVAEPRPLRCIIGLSGVTHEAQPPAGATVGELLDALIEEGIVDNGNGKFELVASADGQLKSRRLPLETLPNELYITRVPLFQVVNEVFEPILMECKHQLQSNNWRQTFPTLTDEMHGQIMSSITNIIEYPARFETQNTRYMQEFLPQPLFHHFQAGEDPQIFHVCAYLETPDVFSMCWGINNAVDHRMIGIKWVQSDSPLSFVYERQGNRFEFQIQLTEQDQIYAKLSTLHAYWYNLLRA